MEKPRDWGWTSKVAYHMDGKAIHSPFGRPGSARAARRPAHPRDAQQRQEEDGEQEEPGGAERSQDEPGAASRSQGGARRSQEEPNKQTGLPH